MYKFFRHFTPNLIFLLLLSSFISLAHSQKNEKTILFVYGGWEGHEPEECKDVILPWLESKGYKVIQSDNLEVYSDSVLMNSLDLIIQTVTMSKITGEQEKGLLAAVKNGVSIAGWHGGLGDSFRNNTGFQFMVGGQFVSHPGGKIDYTVNIIENNAILSGMNDFNINSEQYFMHSYFCSFSPLPLPEYNTSMAL